MYFYINQYKKAGVEMTKMNRNFPQNHKIYKLGKSDNFRMFPSDLSGSLDDFFFKSLTECKGEFILWKKL